MRSLRKPDADTIASFVASQCPLDLSYREVGATATDPPQGYVLDHHRVQVGTGDEAFNSAKAALCEWRQFQLGWVEAKPGSSPIAKGECIGILARALGLWWLNACRIVYVIDEASPVLRFGFAYGTLPDHVGSGEERFLIEMDADGVVWYDVLAFSRPVRLLSRLGYRFLRRVQQRFGPESADAVKRAVESSG